MVRGRRSRKYEERLIQEEIRIMSDECKTEILKVTVTLISFSSLNLILKIFLLREKATLS